jgi:uncharacterized protein
MKLNLRWPALLLISLLHAASNPAFLRAQETTPATPAAVDPEKAALIRQVIDATGAPAAAADNLAAGLEKVRSASPETPEIVWQRLAAKVDPKEIFELIVPIYDAHYTKAELQTLLDFYRSPAGKKFLVEMPKANAEIEAAVDHWAEGIAVSLMQELMEWAAEEPEAANP